ncbi:hypothetical protein AGMMS49525_06970 [Bacteroidia bacterium]|nr:hypothetical protein AGMMS49525_06970 [Bacteroidia bacterium]
MIMVKAVASFGKYVLLMQRVTEQIDALEIMGINSALGYYVKGSVRICNRLRNIYELKV